MRKRTTEEIREIIESFGYTLLYEYREEKNNNTRVAIQDDENYRYGIFLNNFTRNINPDFVAKGNPFTLPNISLWIEKENKPFILCENNVYKGTHEKLSLQCVRESCGEMFDMSWHNIYEGQGCPYCVGKKVGKYNNLAYLKPELVKEWDYKKNKENPEDYTEKSGEEVFWICPDCKHSWKSRIGHRSNGVGCPKCNMSKGEKRIESWLIKNNFEYVMEHRFEDCKRINYLWFDFFLPYIRMCIEYNGEQHYKQMGVWGGKDKLKRTIKSDKIKKEYCKDNGIPLLVIPYWDFDKIEETLENYFFNI